MSRYGLRGRLALQLVLGAAVGLGHVPFSLWFVAFPALAAVLALIAAEAVPRRAAALALSAGTGHFAVALHWIVEPFQVDAARDGWMAPFALVLMAVGLALFWALAGWLGARLGGTARGRRLWALAVALAGSEALRGVVLTGFPWAQPGHLWLDLPAEQLAAWIGPNGLGLLAVLVAATGAALHPFRIAASLGIAGTAVALGAWLGSLPVPPPPGGTVRVVQPNAAQHLKWDPAMSLAFFDRLLTATAAPGDLRPDLVIWPETAVQFLLNRPGAGLAMSAEAAGGVPLVLGIQRTEGWRGYNSLALLGPDGTVEAVYDKHHLVPFGEYIPFGDLAADLFGVTAFAAQEGFGYSAGPGPALLSLGPLGVAAPLICYEAVFPGILRRLPERPGWLLQITNDAWFGQRSGPFQHLSVARLRAIEQGLPLVRAANTGVSAVVDARGRVVAQLGLGEQGFLDVPLPAALPPTPYARWGEAAFLILLALAALPVVMRRTRRH